MNYIQGVVKAIIFHSDENSYTILKLNVTDMTEEVHLSLFDDGDYITITGYFPVPMRGEEIRFYGTFKEHNKYGLQYQVKSYEKLTDTSIPGLIEYLSSDLFNGVGIKTAERVVKVLGKNTIKMILDDKTILDSIPKLSAKQKESIYTGLIENKAAENTLIQLYSYGITPKMAIKIYKYYQTDTISIIEKNPYQLMYDIDGIGFERADMIAKNIGIKDDDPLRIKAMILYLYQLMGTNYGHTFLYHNQLIEYLMKALNNKQHLVEEDAVLRYLDELVEEQILYQTDDIVKLSSVRYAETMISTRIKMGDQQKLPKIDDSKVNQYITLFEQLKAITYTTLQRKAIQTALNSNIFVLTGGPGTGKTTVIEGLVFVYCKYHQLPILYDNPLFSIKLVAPTGRAAKRMNETTNLHAETIHRLLGYGFDGKFLHNKQHLVDADLIIVDEASMIDVFLASQLFQSVPATTPIIIVGDEDQLPSVGPGQVLKDFLDTDMINYVRLNTIHRQADESHIIDLAYAVNQGEIPNDITEVYDDRMFVEETSAHFQTRLIASLHYISNQGYDLWNDVQILIPMYRGQTGIDQINILIQNEFNPSSGHTIVHGDREFRHGDKVIQLSNQMEDGIMNGDQGLVVGITEDGILVVDFDGNEVTYKKGDLIHLKHAYAMSIHKAQGSEYDCVIMPLFRSYSIMLKRKLLYTAITRAKNKLIVIGDLSAFEYGVTRIEEERQSTLKQDIIQTLLEEQDNTVINTQEPILDESIPFDTLGEELNGLSPYDFMDK